MATQYQNYKSDFVLRESFVDITGKAVPLPTDIDFTLRYWTQHGSEYTASRQGGVYQNCAPEDGGTLLVFFKAHNLCEGELHHELHLQLDNEAFEGGVQNVFYPADLHILLWDKASSTDRLTSRVLADYTRGNAFTYDDFTPEQIEELQKPAKEASDRYDAAISDYETKATQQVERITAAANELEELVENFSNETAGLVEAMNGSIDAAQQAVSAAEQKTMAAVNAATDATSAATEAQQRADLAARRAEAAQAAAEVATRNAETATLEAQTAAKEANEAEEAAIQAAQSAREASADATDNAKEARAAAKEACGAILAIEQVSDDCRNIAERAEAAAAAATAAKEAAENATEAADRAKQEAEAATAAASEAKQEAEAATEAARAAAVRAEAATQATEQQRAILEALIERAQHVTAGVPTGMEVTSPATVTIGNPVKQYVRGKVLPTSALQNVLYISDGKAADVLPDGEIVAKQPGTSTVQVIPTDGTRFYKTIQVETVEPRIRTTGNAIRLDAQGNIRLT